MVAPETEGASTPDVSSLLWIIVQTQVEVFRASQQRGDGGNHSRILASVKFPDFDGAVHTTVQRYRVWHKSVLTVKELNQFTDKGLALIIFFSQITGRASMLVEVIGIAYPSALGATESTSM